ncbi:sensor histidine kinase [Thermodesulfovibrio thiophilus]|uniref:sensor histidine kinase n=1 Tax=Thermodesulfovibrio thiophilus TaxID=340095 RepID=UPI00042700F3|nr:sensor histidine kinase [Thermodesulfovibrio thiophilus]
MFPKSIAQKIMIFYIAGIFVTVGLSLIVLSDIWLIKQKIELEGNISNLFETIQEIRRTEKNFFLYKNEVDYNDNLSYIKTVKNFIKNQKFEGLKIENAIQELSGTLQNYEALMLQLKENISSPSVTSLEQSIREQGKILTHIAENIKTTEHKIIKDSLNNILKYSIVLIIIFFIIPFILFGLGLTRLISGPLKELENKMKKIAEGKIYYIEVKSKDKEILSLVETFNKVLKELEAKQKQLIQAEKLSSLGTLMSGIAHELNNPLSNISTSCQILLEELEDSDTQYKKELLQAIESQTERAKNIIKTVLDFSRRRELKKETIPAQTLIKDTIIFIKGELPTKMNLSVEVENSLSIYADKQKIQQVLLNLIKNAIQACDNNGEIKIKVYSSTQEALDKHLFLKKEGKCVGELSVNKEFIIIEVQDNGPGISPEILSKIFEPFFTTKESKGSGLGLFITQELIRDHEGCICVDSVADRGTTFIIMLPKE